MGVIRRLGRRILRGRKPPKAKGTARREAPPPRASPPVPSDAPRVQRVDEEALRRVLAPSGAPRIVNHWATWCEGCIEELPDLVALAEAVGGAADVLAIGWEGFTIGHVGDDTLEQVRRVAAREGISWPTFVFDGEPDRLFELLALDSQQIPQTHVFDGEGNALLVIRGLLQPDDIARVLALVRGAQS